ncbi:MAG: type II and III secretion system protein [Candidatus Nitronauta litoralis]|uniref:Type II and III secretion system protein n=1 Tax=Candidatus Nitronauta litoralis TaxID=2705533 RepID=A0A7T0BZ35_9BACT|nr:MAG: type II and III secretion system protein [Candidatus Nitronauta litoralis]
MASEIIPVIEPLLQGNGTVTGMNDQLIVRSSPQNLQMIQGLLTQLDTRLRNLRITVRQGLSGKRERSSVDVGANIPFGGGRGRVVIPPANRGGGGVTGTIGGNRGVVSGTIGENSRTLDERHTQQVTTLEGRPATIYISQRIPVQTTVTQGVGPFSTRSQSTSFEDVPTGFSVLPKVNGDIVTLEINPTVSKLNARGIQVQEVQTTASGKIGEWIEIGGLLTHTNRSNNRISGSSQSRSHENRSVFFKVEVAD